MKMTLEVLLQVVSILNQAAPVLLLIVGLILGDKFLKNDKAKVHAQKAQELGLIAEDVLRMILQKLGQEGKVIHPLDLKVNEVKVDGVSAVSYLADVADVGTDTAERALISAQQKLSEKI